jgi:hypothetical protein
MKIIFICGCLEPGKDGVGDYTRRLSGEIKRHGIEVGIIALNDFFVKNSNTELQQSEGASFEVLRIPNNFRQRKKCDIAKQWIDELNPEWLSLQYVPYSFNKKGLPYGLNHQLKKMGGSRKWHIMFHELCLGLKSNDSLKYKLIGYVQKNIAKSFKKELNLKVVHTHTQIYLRELNSLKFVPIYLPIFSNIPFNEKLSVNVEQLKSKVKLVMFGTIHPGAPIKDFAKEVTNYFSNNKRYKGSLILLGKSGSEKEKWVKEFKAFNFEVNVLGELEPYEISNVLQEASFGITTNPIFVVEKSGTIAAMREHNLPILIVAQNSKPKNKIDLNFDSDLLEYKSGNFSNFIERKPKKIKRISGITDITFQFLNELGLK